MIFIVGPLIFAFFGWLVVITATMLSTWLSLLLSSTLNSATWIQIRQSAFGNDSDRQIAIDVLRHPVWTTAQAPALPEILASELVRFADEAASRSAPKLRQAVGELAFSLGNEEKSHSVSKYLTWDELIHTAYFKVPRFRKLVCYAIAHSPGFRPSEEFKSDPDYTLVGRWHEQLQPKQSNELDFANSVERAGGTAA
jgi:hypothetical protein